MYSIQLLFAIWWPGEIRNWHRGIHTRQQVIRGGIGTYRATFQRTKRAKLYVEVASLLKNQCCNIWIVNEDFALKQRFGSGSGSTSIPPLDPDPDPDPLQFLSSDPDPDPLKKALIWIRVALKLFRVKSKTKCFCYLRNAFSKFWR